MVMVRIVGIRNRLALVLLLVLIWLQFGWGRKTATVMYIVR